jgi:rhamnose transport system permease protein
MRNRFVLGLNALKSWETVLVLILVAVIAVNSRIAPGYFSVGNQVNLFVLSIEKIIVALVMTLIIINAEIDLSVASVMGLAACLMAYLYANGVPMPAALLIALLAGLGAGLWNGFWVAYAGLPSLVVTLAGLIGFRGLALVFVEDRSIGNFPEWLNRLGQRPLVGPFPLALVVFFIGAVVAAIVLHFAGFGRLVYVIGNSAEVARYSGVQVRRIKMILFTVSGTIAALAGLLYAARLGAVRGSTAQGFELDIITMVLLGGVSIFGGSGTLWGVLLSILIILNLRNGMGLAGFSAHVQTGVIGFLLILSVLIPNLAAAVRERLQRRHLARGERLAASSEIPT